MFRHRRKVGSFALVALLSLGLAACSGGGGGGGSSDLATKDPKAAMQAASKRTVSAKTVQLSLVAKSEKGVDVLSGEGAYDFPKQLGRFKLSTALGTGADLVITPAEIFVRVPSKNPGDKGWIGVHQTDLDAAVTSTNPQTQQSAAFLANIRKQADPRVTLDSLGANVPDLKKVGTEKVRGVKTTHLTGRVDLSDKAIAAAPADKRAGLQQARTAFGADGYPIDVFFDSQGRVRRVSYSLIGGTGTTKTTTKVTLDLFGFGDDPKIAIPAASDVGDGAALLGGATTTTTAAK